MYKIVKIINGKMSGAKIANGEIVGGWLDELEAQEQDNPAFLHLLWNMTALNEAKEQRAAGQLAFGDVPVDADKVA